MRGVLVAFDLETTGLDINNDAIIEIGAVRIENGQILDEYSTVVNPGFDIPPETTHITGIRQSDVADAPMLKQVLPDFRAYVGQSPVIAHNAAFDVGFMRRFDALQDNLSLDTFELASILVPQGSLYNLGSLSEYFSISLENAHRALADARATALLYWQLWEAALKLPVVVLQEMSRAADGIGMDWELKGFFAQALAQASASATTEASGTTTLFDFSQPDIKISPALQRATTPQTLDADAMAANFAEGGPLSTLHEGSQGTQQTAIVRAVSAAFNESKHLLLEVGTGAQRTSAYLLPAMQWALDNSQPVVISTDSRSLRDQLLKQDIPRLTQALGLPIEAAQVKGRRDYLCPPRLLAMQRRGPANLDELRTYAKILVWLQSNPSGNRDDISLRSGEHHVWNRLSAEDEGCTHERCETAMAGQCPFHRARKQAESAHVLVTQHHLLVRDAIDNDQVLPAYNQVIIDDAHRLEDAVTSVVGVRIGQFAILRRLQEIGNSESGLLGDLLMSVKDRVPDKTHTKLSRFISDMADGLEQLNGRVLGFFKAIFTFYYEANKQETFNALRITDKLRDHAEFKAVQEAWQRLSYYLDEITETLSILNSSLEKLHKYDVPQFDELISSMEAFVDYLLWLRGHFNEVVLEPSENAIYWINSGENADRISLQRVPLHVGPLLDKILWQAKSSAVLTGTTLRVEASFEFMAGRLGAENIETLAIGSPFNYKESALLYIPDDVPLPGKRDYQKAVERAIIDLAAALQGRVMALFTSFRQLKETATSITPRLKLGNIAVYDQATGGNRETLLENFLSTEKAVLLGTRSFWDEVDIPGSDLSALVIVRLPFAVPSDPIFAARSETYHDPFPQYAVPEAILRFRQGFGRLIRTHEDRGIVTVLDSRITTKSYGMSFIESLPDCEIKDGSVDRLAAVAREWLNPKTT